MVICLLRFVLSLNRQNEQKRAAVCLVIEVSKGHMF
jgi:hypothetical protein